MDFAGVNYLAVVVAAIAAFLVGWPWYMAFGRQWATAVGRDPDHRPRPRPRPFIILFFCELVMAFVLAGVIGHLGAEHVTLRNGAISGAFIAGGFVLPATLINYTFQGRPARLTLIDGGYFLLVLIVMGAIIGWFGV